MDEMIACSGKQFPLFAKYIEQFPDLLAVVEHDLAAVTVVFGLLNDGFFLGVDVLALGCDAAYRLVGFADQGGFRDVAAYFYWEYELLSKRMVSFVCG